MHRKVNTKSGTKFFNPGLALELALIGLSGTGPSLLSRWKRVVCAWGRDIIRAQISIAKEAILDFLLHVWFCEVCFFQCYGV